MKKEKIKQLVDVMQAYVNGKTIQYYKVDLSFKIEHPGEPNFNDKWVDVDEEHLFRPDLYDYRIKPEFLVKNGFKVRVSRVYYTKLIGDANFLQRNIAIERKRNDWAVFIRYKKIPDSVLLRHIQHVHELQHILWALGLDAELKI